jgi:hypothetical protein
VIDTHEQMASLTSAQLATVNRAHVFAQPKVQLRFTPRCEYVAWDDEIKSKVHCSRMLVKIEIWLQR